MKIAVMARQYSAAEIHPHIIEAHPGSDVTYVGGGVINPLSFDLPRGLSLSAYPWSGEPVWRRNERYSTVFRLAPNSDEPMGMGRINTDLSPIDTFADADLHVLADDTSMGQFANFVGLMKHAGRAGDVRQAQWSDLVFNRSSQLTKRSTLKPFGDDEMAKADGGGAKRRFDYAWAANSVVVLGMAMRKATGRELAIPPSKYGVQLLYRLRETPPKRIGPLIRMMENWHGTGRYDDESGMHDGLGNKASRLEIVRTLFDARLIAPDVLGNKIDDRAEITLTDAGNRFLDVLHPDCRDPDLPFRIQAWMEKGAASHPAIDRYVRAYFGKQLRFARSVRSRT